MHTLSFEVWWDLNNPNCWQFSLQWRWDWLFKPSKAISRPTASPIIGTLSNYDDDAKKKKLVLLAKQQFCTFSSTFLWRPLQDYDRLWRETSQCDVLWRRWTYDDKFSLLYLNMEKALKNSTAGEVAYIWRIERFQMDAIRFERIQIHFLVMFSLPSSSKLLQVSSKPRRQPPSPWNDKNSLPCTLWLSRVDVT